jgi:rhamnogalacturonan endolyase
MQELLIEDFASLPVGPLPTDFSAAGEYHFYPPAGQMGAWYEPLRGFWRPHAPWVVFEDDGRHRLLQAHGADVRPPRILVAGQADWRDYTLKVRLQPLTTDAPVGVLFRYETGRHHYCLALEGGDRLQLVRVEHDRRDVLAEAPCACSTEQPCELEVRVKGDRIEALVDGRALLDARDDRYPAGRIGLMASCPAVFDRVEVLADEPAFAAFVQTRDRRRRELDELREALPRPVVWRRIDTKGFGTGRQVRFGHLRGPDRLDLVLAQNLKLLPGSDDLATVRCLTAIDLEGNVLWQFGEPAETIDAALLTADVAFQLYDLDGDGFDEVLLLKNFHLYVLDGPTGKVRHVYPLPRRPATEGRFGRLVGDAIVVANLRGGDRPADLLVKNRYRELWAFDEAMRPLWHREFRDWPTGHFAQPCDFDGDGRDEVFIGYGLLGPDGELRWSHDWPDHTDEIAIGPFDPDRDDVQIALVCGEAGFNVLAADGTVLHRERLGHAQRLSAAKFRPDLPGLQFYVVTYWGHAGIVSLHDCRGARQFHFEPTALGTILNPVNWTGTGEELALLSGSVAHGGMVDGRGRRVVLFPDDGHPEMCAEALDLTGDARDEIVLWDPERIWIYTQEGPFEGDRIYRPKRYPHHNASNYRAEISLPGWQEVR